LEEIGLEPERVHMVNVSAAMGRKFAQEVTNFTETIRQIGPNPLGKDERGRMKDEA